MAATKSWPTLEWSFEAVDRWVAHAPNGSEFGHVAINDENGGFEVWRYQPRKGSSISLTGSNEPPVYPCLCAAKAAIEAAYLKQRTAAAAN